jgi:hypothetical protein
MGGSGSKKAAVHTSLPKQQSANPLLHGLTEEQKDKSHVTREAALVKRHTMLLLGTAGVGKSTISKQFVIAFGEGTLTLNLNHTLNMNFNLHLKP